MPNDRRDPMAEAAEARTSMWASRASIILAVVTLTGLMCSATWYASAKVTSDAVTKEYSENFQKTVGSQFTEVKRAQDDQTQAFTRKQEWSDKKATEHFEKLENRISDMDSQLRKLMFMACTTPPLGRCDNGVPK